jgi:hypothetical protein
VNFGALFSNLLSSICDSFADGLFVEMKVVVKGQVKLSEALSAKESCREQTFCLPSIERGFLSNYVWQWIGYGVHGSDHHHGH